MSKQRPLGSDVSTRWLVAMCALMSLNAVLQAVLMARSGPLPVFVGGALVFGLGALALVLAWLLWRRLTGREPPKQNA